MLLLTPGSHAYKIIMLLLITGEYPFRSLRLLGNERMVKAMAVRMTQVHEIRIKNSDKAYHCKLLTISGKSYRKTIRLCRSSFELLEDLFPELFENYLIDTYGHRFHGHAKCIERNHRIAEVMAMCMRSGIESRLHLLPMLQKKERKQLFYGQPAFYSSKTIKRLGNDEQNKSKYIRMVGAIFCQAGMYEVYHSRSEVMAWYGQGESKILQTMTDICIYNFPTKDQHHAILFGNDYDVALRTIQLAESGDPNVQLEYIGYQSIHYLPMDEDGTKLLQIMLVKDWRYKLLRLVFEQRHLPEHREFDFDAKIGGTYVLSFLDSDILKLMSFHNTVTQKRLDWEVACFDSQVQFLREYLGEDAVIQPIPLQLIHTQLNAGREALL